MNRTRRALLKSILAGVAGMGMASMHNPLLASTGLVLPKYYADTDTAAEFWAKPRVLNLYRPATGEHREICFWRDGVLDQKGYLEACHMLRDVRGGVTATIDVRLLNILRGLTGWLEAAYGIVDPYEVHSGYRSRKTNAATEGAVRDSFHTKGMAVDGKIKGIPVDYLGRLVAAYQAGGVGFYVASNFIHSDVGRVRYWVR